MKAALALLLVAAAAGLDLGQREKAACKGQSRFDEIMCASHMCTECTLAWCTETCQKVQLMFPECRCSSWPEARTSYSGGDFVGKGSFGDKGDYSTAGAESL